MNIQELREELERLLDYLPKTVDVNDLGRVLDEYERLIVQLERKVTSLTTYH